MTVLGYTEYTIQGNINFSNSREQVLGRTSEATGWHSSEPPFRKNSTPQSRPFHDLLVRARTPPAPDRSRQRTVDYFFRLRILLIKLTGILISPVPGLAALTNWYIRNAPGKSTPRRVTDRFPRNLQRSENLWIVSSRICWWGNRFSLGTESSITTTPTGIDSR